ncbi:MAG TPA: hypothetical protein VLV18_02570 [Terriglobales bacterium]|nr:hypothetical protein [Terriglobales bacterium]
MPSPIVDTFKDSKYVILTGAIAILYGLVLLTLDQFLFFSPYLTLFVPTEGEVNFILDIALTMLTSIVLTASVRQITLQHQSGGARIGFVGIIAALVAGACPCYYLVPLLAVAGTVGGALGAVGTILNAFQFPIKAAAILILVAATYKLNTTGMCKIRARTGSGDSQGKMEH